MRLTRCVSQIEMIIYKLLEWRRAVFPRFPAWHRFSIFCIVSGSMLLAAPWWTPPAVRVANALADVFVGELMIETAVESEIPSDAPKDGCECLIEPENLAESAWYHVPATYGAILILSGLLNYLFFAVILRLPFTKQGFISTSVPEQSTVRDFAQSLADRQEKELRVVDLTKEQENALLAAGSVEGHDLAKVFLDAVEQTALPLLENIHAIETRNVLEIGGPRLAKSQHA